MPGALKGTNARDRVESNHERESAQADLSFMEVRVAGSKGLLVTMASPDPVAEGQFQ